LSDRNDRNGVFTGGAGPGVPVRDVMKDDFGFEIPVESVPLPSRGLVYPPDSPLHGCETVDIRAMTAREEDILTSRALIKKGTVITELIKSCLIDKRIDVPKMLSGDRNALMIALRITGYGADYNVEAECPACNTKSKQTFNLSDLEIKPLQVEPVQNGTNLFEVTLPITKKRVRFKFLTGADEEEILVIQERKKKAGAMGDNLVTTRLQFSLVEVEGKTDKALISSFIRSLPAKDSLFLRQTIDQNEPGIDMKSYIDCPSCSESSEVRIPLGASFFWPDAG
jgi:hypothetical protein